MGSRRLRGPGAGGAMLAAITLAMAGCTHVSDWETRSEVEDTLAAMKAELTGGPTPEVTQAPPTPAVESGQAGAPKPAGDEN